VESSNKIHQNIDQ